MSVIDLGFNSAKLVTYNVKDDDSFEVSEQEGIKAKLGEGLDEKGSLNRKPMARTVEALKLFRDIVQQQPIKSVLPIATSAVREAKNREEFLDYVYKETGFRFKVLSEREEALYSYIGAIKSLQIPDTLFFDLGGGSLEIVYAEKFKIKKVLSLPLGALRLTQQFDGQDGTFMEKNLRNMRRFIRDLLPNKKYLGVNRGAKLVGVGGALRALARYDQKISRYPLDKIHNYKMSFESISTIVKRLSKMKPNDISKISVIGSSRAETITAGSSVINTLMEKFGFNDLYVSNHGLREGALSVFLENQKAYHMKNITSGQVRQTIGLAKPKQIIQYSNFIDNLFSVKIISKREYQILLYARKKMQEKSSFNNPQSLFYSIMDEDMFLSHSDQLVLALSLVHTKHMKTADWLFSRYKSILSQQDKTVIKKISSIITLLKVLDQTKSKIELKRFESGIVELNVTQMKLFPKLLFQNTLKKFEDGLEIHVICMIRSNHGETQNTSLEL